MNKIKFPPLTKECKICKNIYEKKRITSKKVWKKSKYCSFKCLTRSKKGKPFFDSTGITAWNKGKTGYMSKEGRKRIGESTRRNLAKWTPEQRKERYKKTVQTRKKRGSYKGRLGIIGILHESWKGNNASYGSKHKWIQKYWIKTGICQNCGIKPKPYRRRRWGTEWHSLDHKYNREDENTWIEVCKSCHISFDKQL